MDQLFDPSRHEALEGEPWSEAAALAAMARIAARCRDELDARRGWLTHPLDDPDAPGERVWPLYHGAAGVVWALRLLVAEGGLSPDAWPNDDALWPVAADHARDVLVAAEVRHGSASLLLGEAGARMLQWQCAPAQHKAAPLDRMAALVAGNAANPCWEALWGSPGTLLPAIWLAESTAEPRWAELVRSGAQALADAMDQDPSTGLWAWTQDLYGRRVDYLGGGHGLAGNVFPFIRGAAFLPPALVQQVLARSLDTLQALARHATAPDGRPVLNWPGFRTAALQGARPLLVQDCHGAPGLVVRLAGAPRTPAWDTMLAAAAELVWHAGPLVKGPGLCHGTAGNGFAFLKLWRRSGDARWLDRARAFAMHTVAQVEAAAQRHGQGRHSLWTGDPGVAIFLWRCLQAGDRFPTLDHFDAAQH